MSSSAIVSNLQNTNPSAIIELFTVQLGSVLHYNSWEANKSYTVGNVVGHSGSNQSINFKCTVAGQSGTTEPTAFSSASIGQTITDNEVTWTAQSVDIYRFHAGSSLKDNGEIVWAGNTYQRFPIQAEGFAFRKGQLPRPTLTVSNALGTITAILAAVNTTTAGNDLTGATVTRIRTLARFIDAVNFPSNVNPYGTPDSTAEFPQEIYKIDRKSAENREVVQFELASVFDLAGIRAPQRQCTRAEFPSIGTIAT